MAKHRVRAGCAAALLCATLPTSAAGQQPSAHVAIERFTTPNGLRVWIEPRHDSQSVVVSAR